MPLVRAVRIHHLRVLARAVFSDCGNADYRI